MVPKLIRGESPFGRRKRRVPRALAGRFAGLGRLRLIKLADDVNCISSRKRLSDLCVPGTLQWTLLIVVLCSTLFLYNFTYRLASQREPLPKKNYLLIS